MPGNCVVTRQDLAPSYGVDSSTDVGSSDNGTVFILEVYVSDLDDFSVLTACRSYPNFVWGRARQVLDLSSYIHACRDGHVLVIKAHARLIIK